MIHKILCPLDSVGVDYIFPVLQALGTDVDIMVTQYHINNYGPLLLQLEQSGARFLPHEERFYGNYRYVLSEYHHLIPPFSTALKEAACKTITYIHATDTGLPDLARCNYFIAHSETVLRQHNDMARLLFDEGVALFAQSICGQAEAAFSGLYHLGQWETLRHRPRQQFKKEILEQLAHQGTVNPTLPLVVYFEDEYNEPASVMRGLRRLAEHCTVLIKPWTDVLKNLKGPNIFYLGGQGPRLWSAFPLRFAADAVLGGSFSGVGSTSIMLGLSYIPLYSQDLFDNNSMAPLGNIFAYYEKYNAENTHRRLLQRIHPLHIEDTTALLKRIHNTVYWQKYRESLPQWQREIFGQYRIEGAAAYAADLMRSILLRGTMLPSSFRTTQPLER